MKKQIITILTLFVLLFTSVSAQNKTSLSQISGTVMDSRNAPIPYAEVFVGEVRDGEEKILQRTHTDLSARFSLSMAPGNYFFGVSHLGYKLYVSKITLLPNQDLDMGKISLQEDPTELQTVVVQGRSMTVKSTQTGFKVDVTKIREERNNALDLLAGLPNIFVRGEELFIPGKKQIILKIGNVVQRATPESLPRILKGYDARLIKSVEVLMQPPLKYDKDGNTAMIILSMESEFLNYVGGVVGTEIMTGEMQNSRYGGYASAFLNLGRFSFAVSPYSNRNETEFLRMRSIIIPSPYTASTIQVPENDAMRVSI